MWRTGCCLVGPWWQRAGHNTLVRSGVGATRQKVVRCDLLASGCEAFARPISVASAASSKCNVFHGVCVAGTFAGGLLALYVVVPVAYGLLGRRLAETWQVDIPIVIAGLFGAAGAPLVSAPLMKADRLGRCTQWGSDAHTSHVT
jgi:hypothetical protein